MSNIVVLQNLSKLWYGTSWVFKFERRLLERTDANLLPEAKICNLNNMYDPQSKLLQGIEAHAIENYIWSVEVAND